MALELTLNPRFLVDTRGLLAADADGDMLAGRPGYFRLQNTSPDWLVLLRSPAQGGLQQAQPRVTLAGDCGLFPLADLIALLGQSRWTGVLRVTAPSGERSLLLKEGDIRFAASDSAQDRIGEIMVRLGYLGRPALETVLESAPPSRIGKALVDRGLIKAHDLYKCLNEQISEIFQGIMLSREGAFVLVDQPIDDRSLTHNLSLSVNGLLMDSIRKLDELAQFRKRIPHGRMVVTKKGAPAKRLEAEEEAVSAQIDGQRTILDLGQLVRLSEFEVTRMVHHLIELGVARVSEPAVIEPAPFSSSPSSVFEILPTPVPFTAPVTSAAPPIAHSVEGYCQLFNSIFREVRDEVSARQALEPFLNAANAALRGSGVSTSPVLNGLQFEHDGTLSEEQLISRYHQLTTKGSLGPDPLASLKQALSDVMFFLLFQAGELLESAADEALARRVKEKLASLEKK